MGAAASLDQGQNNRQYRQGGGHEDDIDDPQPGFEAGNLAVQFQLHVPQLLAGIEDVLARGVDREALFGRDHRLGIVGVGFSATGSGCGSARRWASVWSSDWCWC